MKKILLYSIIFVFVVSISVTSIFAQSQYEIPEWIKNSADWWSQGLISDGDFLKGITFMVENGIIVV